MADWMLSERNLVVITFRTTATAEHIQSSVLKRLLQVLTKVRTTFFAVLFECVSDIIHLCICVCVCVCVCVKNILPTRVLFLGICTAFHEQLFANVKERILLRMRKLQDDLTQSINE